MIPGLKWAVLGAVVAACVGYLVYSASGGSSEYYLTVSELRSHATSGDVRVAGVVQNDVQRSGGGLQVRFTEKDGTASIPVEYHGTLPDIFQDHDKPDVQYADAGLDAEGISMPSGISIQS